MQHAEQIIEETHQQLEEALDKQKAILNAAPVGIIAFDARGRIIEDNPMARRIFDCMDIELEQMRFGEFVSCHSHNTHADGCGHNAMCRICDVNADLTAVLTGRQSFVRGREKEIFTDNRTRQRIWIRYSVTPVMLRGERGALMVLEDITERNRTNRQMAALYAVVEQSDDIIVVKDLDLRVAAANSAFAKVSGHHSVLDLLGKTDAEIFNVSPDTEPIASYMRDELHAQRLASGEYLLKEELVITADGASRIVLTKKYPIYNELGKLIGTGNISTDITERKQMEEALLESNRRLAEETERANVMAMKAESANSAKTRFLANMSHEIRTPMNAIMGFAQVLERDTALTPQQAEFVHTINRSGDHLLELINDILDMAKIEANRITLEETAFCAGDLFAELAGMFSPEAQAKHLDLRYSCDESVPQYVVGDVKKIRQVLLNLLGNAVKFTSSGCIAFRVQPQEIPDNGGKNCDWVWLSAEVEDSGPGIALEHQDLIFEAFQQSETGMKAGGTGLGLAISKRFAEMMGGQLNVTSEPGLGALFRFLFPVKRTDAVKPKRRLPSSAIVGLHPSAAPILLLTVDDNSVNRFILRKILQPVGFELIEAENGAEALDLFAQHQPQAILMDMRMPVMDGYEAIRRIRAAETDRRTPIVAVTASAFEDSEEKVRAIGADAYLRKPFRRDELFLILEDLLQLKYIYAEEQANPSADTAATPKENISPLCVPAALAPDMRRAVESGDMTELARLIDAAALDYPDVAAVLRGLAHQYAYDELMQVLNRGDVSHE